MGREFLEVFSEWAEAYDTFVEGNDIQYKAVFRNYEQILEEIVARSGDKVLEFGIGTGNLTQKLIDADKQVFAVEPSAQMRERAKEKLPEGFAVYDGDMQQYPTPNETIDTVVSSYVFHHLTDNEKRDVLKQYIQLLPKGGKVVFADTLFISKAAYQLKIEEASNLGYAELVDDLRREYYPLLKQVQMAFEEAGFVEVSFQQMNEYVWIMEGTKTKS
ncbi:class I SAM-dependent methyltransferase [Marinilactibacillus sp. Marseille-P9653]|uniref:class I SAM-dependent methyltransferase n=1 Tax=Marinilactibacillus sp. Marseille-P9653 TaxID=2866583 RepID=UPI001CE458C6|nr:class I SAM-dependent methyltransferase [Marinilactibacillus sp. Marseille-P9653]